MSAHEHVCDGVAECVPGTPGLLIKDGGRAWQGALLVNNASL